MLLSTPVLYTRYIAVTTFVTLHCTALHCTAPRVNGWHGVARGRLRGYGRGQQFTVWPDFYETVDSPQETALSSLRHRAKIVFICLD